LLGREGIASRVIHSRLRRADRDEAVRLFRAGRLSALVNVGILTEGFNVPEIDAVFLCRPTSSDVLLQQMIGRGYRKAPGKDSFGAVDSAANLQRPQDRALRARTLLPAGNAGARSRPYRPPPRHVAPTGQPRFENLAVPGHGTVPVAVGQTFGVEIEL